MAKIPKRWTRYLPYLEFYLKIPLILIQTRILTEAVERATFDIIRIRIQIWKWSFEFQLYKRWRDSW